MPRADARASRSPSSTGPDARSQLVDLPEPEAVAPADARARAWSSTCSAAGVSFPEVLQTRGEYQFKPDAAVRAGQRGRRASCAARPTARASRRATASRRSRMLGGFAEVAVAPAFLTFPLPDALDFAQGAGADPQLPHGLLRAEAARAAAPRARRVLVHGAAGGVGTATLQVAKGLGARTIAVVSSDEKERVAREAGADEVVRSDGAVEGRGQGAVRRRRRRRARPGRRRPLHRQPALAARGRPRWSSSASPAARSPRSRSTGCCSTTSRSSAPAGAPT